MNAGNLREATVNSLLEHLREGRFDLGLCEAYVVGHRLQPEDVDALTLARSHAARVSLTMVGVLDEIEDLMTLAGE